MSSVFRNIDPPPPYPRLVCTPPPLVREEDTLAEWRGGAGSTVRKDARHCSVLYICKYFTLCLPLCFQRKTVRRTGTRVPQLQPKVRMQLLYRATRDFNEDIFSKLHSKHQTESYFRDYGLFFLNLHTCQAAQRCMCLAKLAESCVSVRYHALL